MVELKHVGIGENLIPYWSIRICREHPTWELLKKW